MAVALTVEAYWSSPNLRATGPLSAAEAAEMVATLCEAAIGEGGFEGLASVTFETDPASPGRGIDYEGITLSEDQCQALRKLAALMALDDGLTEGERADSGGEEVAFEMEPIQSATLAAARLASHPERMAKLKSLTGLP